MMCVVWHHLNRSALRAPLISEHTDSICNDCLVEQTGSGSRGKVLLHSRGLDFEACNSECLCLDHQLSGVVSVHLPTYIHILCVSLGGHVTSASSGNTERQMTVHTDTQGRVRAA